MVFSAKVEGKFSEGRKLHKGKGMSWNYPPSFRVPVIIRNIPTFRFGNHDLNLPLWRLHPGSRGGLTDKMSTKNTSQRLRWKVDPNSIYTLPIQLPISTTCMGSLWEKHGVPRLGVVGGIPNEHIEAWNPDGPCSQGKVWKLFFSPPLSWISSGGKLRRCRDQTNTSPVWEFPHKGSEVRIRESDPQNGLSTFRLRIYNHKLPSNCPDVMMNSPTKSC